MKEILHPQLDVAHQYFILVRESFIFVVPLLLIEFEARNQINIQFNVCK